MYGEREDLIMAMTLLETSNLMVSEDYKERFLAEYYQLCIRTFKLSDVLNKYYHNALEFELSCPIWLLEEQYRTMRQYIEVMQHRAELEKIDLGNIIDELEKEAWVFPMNEPEEIKFKDEE